MLLMSSYGSFQGCLEDSAQAFHGIPYTQPPVGNRRIRASILVKK